MYIWYLCIGPFNKLIMLYEAFTLSLLLSGSTVVYTEHSDHKIYKQSLK